MFIGRFLFNSKVGIISSILSILYLPNLFTPNLLLTEVIFYFLILLLVYTTLVAIKSREIKHYIIGGIVWGIAKHYLDLQLGHILL
ncbi:glycosyltransferase family 39 protein [Clostridium perfringens]|nr:glycosyltransferase family 39 protein [Clostridium perfringens]